MNRASSYDDRYKQQMNTLQEGLSERLDRLPALEADLRDAAMRYLLELACQSQNAQNIVIGREALWSLPREWLLTSIEDYAESLLQLDDEWEYRRLTEVYAPLNADLLQRLLNRGMTSKNPEIQETARECAPWQEHQ